MSERSPQLDPDAPIYDSVARAMIGSMLGGMRIPIHESVARDLGIGTKQDELSDIESDIEEFGCHYNQLYEAGGVDDWATHMHE